MNSIRKAAPLFFGASLLYFLTRSPALDEHDSVQLAMGVLDFNMWKDQPHAPGYPVFIFLAWVAHTFFGTSPDLALHLLSAVGGGLFVATWFLIIRRQFDERLAWWTAACLTITAGVWMTATKALTDSLASGLLAAQILATLYLPARWQREPLTPPTLSQRQSRVAPARLPAETMFLVISCLLGAATTGVRPQLILVVLAIVITGLWRSGASAAKYAMAILILLIGCLLWLVPTSWSQWRFHPEMQWWSVFPKLAYHQWTWRTGNAAVYLGAGDWSPGYLITRVALNFLICFGVGFGLIKSAQILLVGSIVMIGIFTAYGANLRPTDRSFWRFHGPWALTHVGIIFVTLSPVQRYYLPVFPLILVALVQGLLRLRIPWNRIAGVMPAVLLYFSIPLAVDNHRRDPPALCLVHYLGRLYPKPKRSHILLLLNRVRRHAEWYAPDFVTIHEVTATQLREAGANATAIYTDDRKAPLPPGWHRVPLVIFMRPGTIYWKHRAIELYLIDRGGH